MKERIGIGIITCDRPSSFLKCIKSLPYEEVDEIVVVNDGVKPIETPYAEMHIVEHTTNKGIAVSKNNALKYLYDKECDHIFISEDDIIFKDPAVFSKYIETSKASGIQHLNYALGTPFNRKQKTHFDLYNRDQLDLYSDPNPKLIVDYGNDVKVALYEHIAGMFSYYHRDVLTKIGYIDELYKNAWEHVDHTYQVINAGYHPSFWWFADIINSDKYIEPQKDSILNSSTSKNTEKWLKNVQDNAEKYRIKNGHYPAQTPQTSQEEVVKTLQKIKKTYG